MFQDRHIQNLHILGSIGELERIRFHCVGHVFLLRSVLLINRSCTKSHNARLDRADLGPGLSDMRIL